MKFTCDKVTLCEAVNNVSPAVSGKSTMMALECVLLKCHDNILSVIGYNLELGITKDIEIQTFQDGEVILNARLFSDIINKMPNVDLTLTTDDKLLTIIKGGGAQFTILGMSADEYPEIPPVSQDHAFSIDGNVLRSMISQTLFAVSQDSATPVLTGTLFEVKDGILYLVSVDGCRLAVRKENVECRDSIRFIVPGKTLSEVLKLTGKYLSDEDELPIQLNIGSKHIIFECKGYRVISRLLEGEFIDYNAAIPKESKTNLVVSTREFLESINRASIIINDKVKNPIKAVFENNSVNVSCETSMGKVSDTFALEMTGERVKIGFNNKYMTDALKASELDQVRIEINSAFSPIKLLPMEGDHFIFLVMPMRLKDEN